MVVFLFASVFLCQTKKNADAISPWLAERSRFRLSLGEIFRGYINMIISIRIVEFPHDKDGFSSGGQTSLFRQRSLDQKGDRGIPPDPSKRDSTADRSTAITALLPQSGGKMPLRGLPPANHFPFSSAIPANGRRPIFAGRLIRGIKGAAPLCSSSFLSDIFSSVEEEKMPS